MEYFWRAKAGHERQALKSVHEPEVMRKETIDKDGPGGWGNGGRGKNNTWFFS